jgi:hypothetical protein
MAMESIARIAQLAAKPRLAITPHKHQGAYQPTTGAIAVSERPPSRAAPGYRQLERSHTPQMRAAVTVRSPHAQQSHNLKGHRAEE